MSELIVTSGHGVQETPEAILEVRRILGVAVASAASSQSDAIDDRHAGDVGMPCACALIN